jgi:hypothetical protein
LDCGFTSEGDRDLLTENRARAPLEDLAVAIGEPGVGAGLGLKNQDRAVPVADLERGQPYLEVRLTDYTPELGADVIPCGCEL